jgi:Glycosyl transferase family 2
MSGLRASTGIPSVLRASLARLVLAGRPSAAVIGVPGESWTPVSPMTGPRPLDRPKAAVEAMVARARHRNPPLPAWRRRNLGRWQTTIDGLGPTERPSPGDTRLFAVTAVWNEGDVTFATVRNLLDQGVDRVFVIDDDSDDETADEARAAGATVIRVVSDGVYREVARGRKIQDVIRRQTRLSGGDAWWVIADADEFPRGPGGATIRDLVERLPGSVDVVGSRVLDHWPSEPDAYRPRTHPVRSQPLAQWYRSPYCPLGHWKHQLVRVRDGDDVLPLPGHHVAAARDGRRLREAEVSLLMHHVPLRNRDRTAARLRRASAPGGRYLRSPDRYTRWRLAQRLEALEHVYARHYDAVPSCYAGEPRHGVILSDWRDLVPVAEWSL